MKEYIIPIGQLVIILGVLYSITNGKLKSKVSRGECHRAQEMIRDKVDTLDKHINERFEDLKDFIKKNGK